MQFIQGRIDDKFVDHKNIQNIGIRTHDEIDSDLTSLESLVDQDVTIGSYPTFNKLLLTQGSILSSQFSSTTSRRWYKILDFDKDSLGRYFNMFIAARLKVGTAFIPFTMHIEFSTLNSVVPIILNIKWNTTMLDGSSKPLIDILHYQDTTNAPYNSKLFLYPQLNVACNFLITCNQTCDFNLLLDGNGTALPIDITTPPYTDIYNTITYPYASSDFICNNITCLGIRPSYGSDLFDRFTNSAQLSSDINGPWTIPPVRNIYFKNVGYLNNVTISDELYQVSDLSSIIYFNIDDINYIPTKNSKHPISVYHQTASPQKQIGILILEASNPIVTIVMNTEEEAFVIGETVGFCAFSVSYI